MLLDKLVPVEQIELFPALLDGDLGARRGHFRRPGRDRTRLVHAPLVAHIVRLDRKNNSGLK